MFQSPTLKIGILKIETAELFCNFMNNNFVPRILGLRKTSFYHLPLFEFHLYTLIDQLVGNSSFQRCDNRIFCAAKYSG